MPVSLANLETTKAELTDFSVVTGASGQTALSYVNTTGVFTLTPVLSLTDLNIADGTSGQVLMTDGSGNFTFTTMGAPLAALSVTQNAAGTATLAYDNATGVFTYTPPDLSTLIELTDLQVLTAAAGTAALTYNNTNGEFIFTPEDVSAKIELADLSITTATAGTAALAYDNATGVFTYTPPDLSAYLTAETTTSLAYTAGTQTLTFTDETGTATNIDLSGLLDDTNIITSVNTQTGAVVLDLLDLGITDGTNGQVLSTDGAGTFTFVDDVVGIGLTDLSVTTATAGTAALAYDNATGVFTFTPEDISAKIELTNLSVTTATAGTAALAYDNATGVFTYTPPVVPTDLTDLNITDGTNGQVLTTDGAGTFTFSDVATILAGPSVYEDVNGSTSTFTIESGHTVNTVIVFYNGICLVPTTDYTVSGTTLTITFTPVANSDIVIRYFPI